MPADPRSQALLERANRALGENQVSQAVAKVRAVIGPPGIPASEPDAQSAWDKLRNGETPTARELAALEIVIRLLRPAPLCLKGGKLEDLPEAQGHNLHPPELKELWSAFRLKVEPLLYSIGRVETAAGKHVGTGFLVGDGLLATNRHVLDDLSFGAERLDPGQARVVFQRESGATDKPEHIVAIEGVHGVHATLDMALLAVPKLGRPVVEVETGAAPEGHRVVAIGYPAEDRGRNPLFLAAVFRGKFGVKRAALGEVLDGSLSPTLYHDCSTTGGSSGSPLFSMASGRAVGIHRSGFFMYRNEALDAGALRGFVG